MKNNSYLKNDLREVKNEAMKALHEVSNSPGRTLPGIRGQTVESTLKATKREISDYQLDCLYEAMYCFDELIEKIEN